ncbi:hypothetical protein LCGC14_0891450 [marine sediment metagenome]|uniref:Uncharacterized protein n=1 Tax=marine sediment metagenome TaxID=412755 RepID=A0A0F9RIH5_9ZZZZ
MDNSASKGKAGMKRYIIIFLLLCRLVFADTFTSSLKPNANGTLDIGTLALQWDNAWGDGTLSWDTITDDVFSITAGVGTGLVSLTDGTASWSSNSLSGFVSISGTTLTDTVLSINSGSITSAINGTFSGTVQAEQLTSTDDATIVDDLTVGGNVTITGTLSATTLTDTVTTITGGNYTGVGNITGTDVDITAGTGDYLSTGDITLNGGFLRFSTDTPTANTLISIKTDATVPTVTGLIEIVDSSTDRLPNNAGIIVDLSPSVKATAAKTAGAFSLRPTGAMGTPSSSTFTGVFGSIAATIDPNTRRPPSLIGLQYTVSNDSPSDTVEGGAKTGFYKVGGAANLTSIMAAHDDTYSALIAEQNFALKATANMDGTYNADPAFDEGFNAAIWAITGENFVDIDVGEAFGSVMNSYGVFIDAAVDPGTFTAGDFFTWTLYGLNDVPSFLAGDLYFMQTDGAERITSDADGTLDLYAGTSVNLGNPSTTEFTVETDGDTFWTGDGTGLPYACMYVDGTQAIIVALSTGVIAEVKDDDTTSLDDGWLAGDLNLITFPTGGDEHYLSVTKAGFYRIQWSLSFNTANPGANVEIHGGIAVDGTAIRNKAEAHRTIANNSDTGNMSGTAMIEAPNGTEQISVWLLNTTNNADVTVEHGNVSMVMVGGT